MTDPKSSEEKRKAAEKMFEAEKAKLLAHIEDKETVKAVTKWVQGGAKEGE